MTDDMFPWLSRRTAEIPLTERDRVVVDHLARAVVQFYERTGKYPTQIAMRPGALSVEPYDICGIRIIWSGYMREGEACLFMLDEPPRFPIDGEWTSRSVYGVVKL